MQDAIGAQTPAVGEALATTGGGPVFCAGCFND
jgi:hypothetical protein